MGQISIATGGSFPTQHKTFSAMGNGHAHAVAEAIAWLSREVLPAAIEQDHALHDEGARPVQGFNRPEKSL